MIEQQTIRGVRWPFERRSVRVTMHCDICGTKHPLERLRTVPEDIALVCHGCEAPIMARWPARR